MEEGALQPCIRMHMCWQAHHNPKHCCKTSAAKVKHYKGEREEAQGKSGDWESCYHWQLDAANRSCILPPRPPNC